MWLGHSIEHLMCIGGELEHHKALSPSAREKQSTGVLCSRARVYIGTSLVPVCPTNRDQKVQTNRDQCALLLVHHHLSRLVA